MTSAIKQQLKMRTQAHPSHLYVRNKSPKATQGVMNPRVSSHLAPSVSWPLTERRKYRQIYSKGARTPLNPGPWHLPQSLHAGRHLPSINAWRSTIQSRSTPKVILRHKHSNLCLLCAVAEERAPSAVVSVVIYMQPLRWVV